MRFTISRDTLLAPLQIVNGVVERRQALPILANVLLCLDGEQLSLTATDMEVELVARARVSSSDARAGEITVPARKFIDICRSLPGDAELKFQVENGRALIRSGRSRFTLSTLPSSDYPVTEAVAGMGTVRVKHADLKRIIDLTQFAMAHQDVRYYLNGMLFELQDAKLRAVATDGHRLAMAEADLEEGADEQQRQLIIPRKGVLELSRLLSDSEEVVELAIGPGSVRATVQDVSFASKLVDGRFPDYQRVIPQHRDTDKHVVAAREVVRQSLARASILSNEKYRAVRLNLKTATLHVAANNPEHEEAEDEIEVDFEGEALEIGFNVSYLMDALAHVPSETVSIFLTDAGSSCLILPQGRDDCQYVVMPMRL